jgi:hypothetical protein
MNAETKLKAGTAHVYQAICEVQAELAKTGISKSRKNEQQGYKFRGIDEVYAALSPLLAKHKLVVVPRVLDRQMLELRSAKGTPLYNVTVRAEFDFVSALDGTTHTAATFGEAMDTADKATNKAMSAAYKYAAFMTFAIPTEGDNDADAVTHEVGGYVTEAQLHKLQDKANAVGADLQRFCNYFGIASLKEIPADKFDAAMAALDAKAKRQPEPVK